MSQPLVVSLLSRPPHPARDGAGIRNYHMLAALAETFRVRAVALMPPSAADLPWAFPPGVDGSLVTLRDDRWTTLQSCVRSLAGMPYTVAKYRSEALDVVVSEMVALETPSWIVAHSYHLAPAAFRTTSPVWVDLHNVDSLVWLRLRRSAASPFVRAASAWQYPLVKQFEASIYERAAGISAVSEADAELIRSSSSGARPLVVPNGVDLERYRFRADPTDEQILLFVGDLRWQPNAEGVAWFARSVWPRLRYLDPDARVEILGRGARPDLLRLADDRLTFLGDAPDTRPAWARAAIAIVPLQAGSGTRLKILEAAAMGVPVVSTTVGAEGLTLEPEEQLVVRDEPADWATAIAALLADPARRHRIAESARRHVAAHYDWVEIGRAFADHLAAGASDQRRQ